MRKPFKSWCPCRHRVCWKGVIATLSSLFIGCLVFTDEPQVSLTLTGEEPDFISNLLRSLFCQSMLQEIKIGFSVHCCRIARIAKYLPARVRSVEPFPYILLLVYCIHIQVVRRGTTKRCFPIHPSKYSHHLVRSRHQYRDMCQAQAIQAGEEKVGIGVVSITVRYTHVLIFLAQANATYGRIPKLIHPAK